MTHVHIDASTGAAGDMLLAALVDAGADPDAVRASVAAVVGDAVSLTWSTGTSAGLRAGRLQVTAAAQRSHRTWRAIRDLLTSADLTPGVRRAALSTFVALAEAEGRVHGVDPDTIQFHEVGALDAIADVVGVNAALADLGVHTASCTSVGVGSGMARTAHGRMPLPVPAVAELLRGAPTAAGPLPFEACTPTAAALLRTHVSAWGGQPPMVVSAVGVGAGTREIDGVPNVVRVFVGEVLDSAAALHQPAGRSRLIETNIDDMDPRLWPSIIEALLAAGAADAWLTPILMKKGRPAHTLSVLVADDRSDQVRRVVFEQTTAIGLRESTFDKVALARDMITVDVLGHPIAVKIARDAPEDGGDVLNAQPEWEDVRTVAQVTGRPAKVILQMAVAAAHHHVP